MILFIIGFYLFTLVYGVGLSIVTNTYHFTRLSDFLFGGLWLIIGAVASFITLLIITWLMGIIRQNKPIDNTFNHRFANSLLRFALHIGRIKVTVTGKENIPDHNFILVGNHQENYDIIILKPIFKDFPLDFVAKESLKKMPIFGRWIRLLGNVFISREANRSAARSIIKGIKHYKQGVPMSIFPEGQRSRSNVMIDFKPGAFKLAMKPKADIVIVTLYDVCQIFKHFPFKRYHVKVHIHPLLKYDDYKTLSSIDLSDTVKHIIQKQLDVFAKQAE